MTEEAGSGLIAQRQIRLDKVKKLRKIGIDPYPSKSNRDTVASDVTTNYNKLEGNTVTVAGRIMALREFGKIGFATLQDQSGRIQLYLKKGEITKTNSKSQTLGLEDINLVDIGDIVEAKGTVTKTERGEISILVKELRMLVKAIRPLPEKWQGLKNKEIIFRNRYLDTIVSPEKRERFEKYAQVTFAIREFLNNKGFLEIKTPILQPLYGGGMAKPFKTYMNALSTDFYLSISHELYLKRLITAGFEKVYNLVGYFRNEGIDRTHNPEFTMLETMSAFENYEYNMDLIEEMYKYIAQKVFGKIVFNVKGKEVDFIFIQSTF